VKRNDAEAKPTRAFSDYVVEIDKAGIPVGVTLEEKI
jgi:hypothetical protein